MPSFSISNVTSGVLSRRRYDFHGLNNDTTKRKDGTEANAIAAGDELSD